MTKNNMKNTFLLWCIFLTINTAHSEKQIKLEDIEKDNLASELYVKHQKNAANKLNNQNSNHLNNQLNKLAPESIRMEYGFTPMKVHYQQQQSYAPTPSAQYVTQEQALQYTKNSQQAGRPNLLSQYYQGLQNNAKKFIPPYLKQFSQAAQFGNRFNNQPNYQHLPIEGISQYINNQPINQHFQSKFQLGNQAKQHGELNIPQLNKASPYFKTEEINPQRTSSQYNAGFGLPRGTTHQAQLNSPNFQKSIFQNVQQTISQETSILDNTNPKQSTVFKGPEYLPNPGYKLYSKDQLDSFVSDNRVGRGFKNQPQSVPQYYYIQSASTNPIHSVVDPKTGALQYFMYVPASVYPQEYSGQYENEYNGNYIDQNVQYEYIQPEAKSVVQPQIYPPIPPQINSQVQPQIQAEIQQQIPPQIQSQIHPQIQSQIYPQTQSQTYPQTQIHPQNQPQINQQTFINLHNQPQNPPNYQTQEPQKYTTVIYPPKQSEYSQVSHQNDYQSPLAFSQQAYSSHSAYASQAQANYPSQNFYAPQAAYSLQAQIDQIAHSVKGQQLNLGPNDYSQFEQQPYSNNPNHQEGNLLKKEPQSLLDSYVPSILQVQYYNQQQLKTPTDGGNPISTEKKLLKPPPLEQDLIAKRENKKSNDIVNTKSN